MFDTLRTDAAGLQQLLQDGKITSVQIVNEYLAKIDAYNPRLNAFIAVAPRDVLLRAASSLDEERSRGRVRGPLHGIPIVLKDCFVTDTSLGMISTGGAWAFREAKAKGNSAIAQKLIDAGLIILAKGNMTELCGMQMFTTPGRSAVGGQTLSPYTGALVEDEGIIGHSSPGGSSVGSAVAVAAGFSPLSLGSETVGSIVTPACRGGLYAMKPTVGVQDTSGMYVMTEFFDSPGPMAKSAADLVCITEVLLGRSFQESASKEWKGLSVGFASPETWKLGDAMCRQYEGTAEQMVRDYHAAVSRLGSKGCRCKYPIDLPSLDGEMNTMPIAFWEFRHIGLPGFIRSFEECPVKDLEELVKFNEENKEKAIPPPHGDQELLKKALNLAETPEQIEQLKKDFRDKARQGLDQVFASEGVDLIAAPTDSGFATHAAAAGYPTMTVPLGQLEYNKRPIGLCLMAKPNEEEKLLHFAMAYEAASPPRPVPDLKREETLDPLLL